MKKSESGFTVVEGLLVVIILLLLGVIGWHVWMSRAKTPTSTTAKTLLTISRANPLNQPKVSTFHIQVTDPQLTSTIRADISKLPAGPTGIVNCPADDGVVYTLVFVDPTLTVVANATGCQSVIVSSSSKAYIADTAFWSDIRQATNQPTDPNFNLSP